MTFDRWPQPETLRAAPDYTIGQLQAAMAEGQILTGQAVHCDAALNLHIRLGALSGIMPRGECVAPFLSGAQREIAVLSCVGRGVCCRVTGQRTAPNGDTELLLSRRLAQEEAMDYIEAHAEPGLVIPAQITHLAPFGAFADIGCGVVALLPLASISTAHIRHPRERFAMGQRIFAVVQEIDRAVRRITLSHKELLGTWRKRRGLPPRRHRNGHPARKAPLRPVRGADAEPLRPDGHAAGAPGGQCRLRPHPEHPA